MSLIIPTFDLINGNHSCVLYKTYGQECSTYVLNRDIAEQIGTFKNIKATSAIVHVVGYFIFYIYCWCSVRIFTNVTELIVIDGSVPENGMLNSRFYQIGIPMYKSIYIFLENRITARVDKHDIKDIKIVNAIDFGSNLICSKFTAQQVIVMLEHVRTLYESKHLMNNIYISQFR